MVTLSLFNRTATAVLAAAASTMISATPLINDNKTAAPAPAPPYLNLTTTASSSPSSDQSIHARNSTHWDPELAAPVADEEWTLIDDARYDYQICGYRDIFDPRACAQKTKKDAVCQRDPRRHDVDVNICLRVSPSSDIRPCHEEYGWTCDQWGIKGLECFRYPKERDDFRTVRWPKNMGMCLRPVTQPDLLDLDMLYKTFGQYRVCRYSADVHGDTYWGQTPGWPVQDTTECWAMTDACIKDPRFGDRYMCLDDRDNRQCRLTENWYCPTGYRCWPDFQTFHKPPLEAWGWCLQTNRGGPAIVSQYPDLL